MPSNLYTEENLNQFKDNIKLTTVCKGGRIITSATNTWPEKPLTCSRHYVTATYKPNARDYA